MENGTLDVGHGVTEGRAALKEFAGALPAMVPFTTTSHSDACARWIMRSMRGPTSRAFVAFSVVCWPTIGAMSESITKTNRSSWFCCWFVRSKTLAPRKRRTVSTLPSWRTP